MAGMETSQRMKEYRSSSRYWAIKYTPENEEAVLSIIDLAARRPHTRENGYIAWSMTEMGGGIRWLSMLIGGGQWLVRDYRGGLEVWPDALFNNHFEPVTGPCDGASEYWCHRCGEIHRLTGTDMGGQGV